MSVLRGIGDVAYLRKRIPQNPKYQHVKTRLDTGCSLTKYMERIEEGRKNYRYRKGELFKRFKVTTFAQLVIHVAAVSDFEDISADEDSSIKEESGEMKQVSEEANDSPQPALPLPQNTDNENSPRVGGCPRTMFQSLISGVGELDLDESQKTKKVSASNILDVPYPDCPYLLLDVRDQDEYDQCHIISAYSFPITRLSRTINPYTKEVLDYKNASGKIIIMYDDDELKASQAATILCERGFDNVFLLSGGLKVVAQKIPEGLTTGLFPTSCLPEPSGPKGRKRSVREPISLPAQKSCRFTTEELNKIQCYLEEVYVPSETSSRLSSRMSTSSAFSKASSVRSSRTRQGSSIAGSESARSQSTRPWK